MDGPQLYSLQQYSQALTGVLFLVKAVVSVMTDSVAESRVESSPAQLIMETQCHKDPPAWSTEEVMDLIAVWGEESVKAELQSSRRNAEIYAKLARGMGEKGYTRDTQQCRMKIKELQQVYRKTREANSHSGSAHRHAASMRSCLRFSAATPSRSVDTFEEPWVTSSNNEEDIVDEGEEKEENERQASGGSILLDSQELYLTLEPVPSQDQLVAEREAGEGTSAETLSIGISSTPGQRLSQIRRRKKKTQEDMFSELMCTTKSDKTELRAWRNTLSEDMDRENRRVCREQEHVTQEEMLWIMKEQSDMLRASELRVLSRAVTMEHSGIADGAQYCLIASTVPQIRPSKADFSANPLVGGGVRKSILRAF
ncbi:hypothetical protein UY3_02703 [Chelonia mydas]|uniref:Myb/SANT-like DNA-binding domain-containing protein n=1 Tax=Chelonia mydas TaxID=8469 RepID=M7CGL4_CHEMY|nr:hypothetical protein UY3_02703 [Chelonia mydas]